MDQRLAAVDLGSNTFRLAVGHVAREAGAVRLVYEDRLRELVSLSAGLDAHQCLRPETCVQALAALGRFGARLRGFPPERVRVVATSTFRTARNIQAFLPRAEQALGFRIDIISGREEARLIYGGVVQGLADSRGRRLVIDIGGGSTEFIAGEDDRPRALESLPLGCTSHTLRYFPDGRITAARLDAATQAARNRIQAIATPLRRAGWQHAYGTSGTAKGLLAILRENGFSTCGITRAGMERFGAALVQAGEVRLADWAGLKPERAPVLIGGLAILLAAFQVLDIGPMQAGNGALRVGVLADLAHDALVGCG